MHVSPLPLESQPMPMTDVAFMNRCYLYTTPIESDATMVWGTEVDMTEIQCLIRQRNRQSRTLMTTMSILVRSVGLALAAVPQFNTRILRGRIHRFTQANVVIPVQRKSGGVTLSLLRDVDRKSYTQISQSLWAAQQSALHGTETLQRAESIFRTVPPWMSKTLLRLLLWVTNNIRKPMNDVDEALLGAPVVVNHFGFPGAPPLRSYKPSRFATNCSLMNVTLGPTEMRPCVIDGKVQVRPMAGLFVRADHRTADARELAQFTSQVVEKLIHPEQFDLADGSDDNVASNGPSTDSTLSSNGEIEKTRNWLKSLSETLSGRRFNTPTISPGRPTRASREAGTDQFDSVRT